jgi:hypothetical protein
MSRDESKPIQSASIQEAFDFFLKQNELTPKDKAPKESSLGPELQAEFDKNLQVVRDERLGLDLMSSQTSRVADEKMWESMVDGQEFKAQELRSIAPNQVPRVLPTSVYKPRSTTSTSNNQKGQSSKYPWMLPNGRPDSDKIDRWIRDMENENEKFKSEFQKKQEKLERLRSQRSGINVTSQIAVSDQVPGEYGYQSGQLTNNSVLFEKLLEEEKITIEENKKFKPSTRIKELPPAPTLLSRESQNTSYQRQKQHQQNQQHQQQRQRQYQRQHEYQRQQGQQHQRQQYHYPHPLRSRGQFGPASIHFSQSPYGIYSNYSQYSAYSGVAQQVPAYYVPASQYRSAPSSYQPFEYTPTTDESSKSQSPRAPKEAENAWSSLTSQADTVKSSSPRHPLDIEPPYLRDETLRGATKVSAKISDYGSAPLYPSVSSSNQPWFKNIESQQEIFYSKPVSFILQSPVQINSEEVMRDSNPVQSNLENPQATKQNYLSKETINPNSYSVPHSPSLVPSKVASEQLPAHQSPGNADSYKNIEPTANPPESKNAKRSHNCSTILRNFLSCIYNGAVSIYYDFPRLADRFINNLEKTMSKKEAGESFSKELPSKGNKGGEGSGSYWRKFAIFSRSNDDNESKKTR